MSAIASWSSETLLRSEALPSTKEAFTYIRYRVRVRVRVRGLHLYQIYTFLTFNRYENKGY